MFHSEYDEKAESHQQSIFLVVSVDTFAPNNNKSIVVVAVAVA